MDHRYRVDAEHGLAVIRLGFAVRGSDIVLLLDAVLRDPAWQPGFARFWDGRGVRHLDVQPNEMEEHSAFLDTVRDLAGQGKSAIVTFRDIDHLAAMLYQARVRRLLGVDIQVFSEIEDAADFLSVPVSACTV